MYKLLFSFFCVGLLFSQEVPFAIAVGRGIVSPYSGYSVFVSSDGTLTEIPSPSPSTSFQYASVSMNSLGTSIFGANNNLNGYMAYVSPLGDLTTVTGEIPASGGSINSVSINNSSVSIAGGVSSSQPYIALISSSAVATEVTGDTPSGNGSCDAVSINNSGISLAGGRDNGSTTPYVLQISPSGVATRLSGSDAPGGSGRIFSVAINESSQGIVGGVESTSSPYAALVSSSGAFTKISGPNSPQSQGLGNINSVAINASGNAIIGGISAPSGIAPYAALISSEGQITQVSGPEAPPSSTFIFSVAINNSGVGIIGGARNSGLGGYAALISPSGEATSISGAGAPQGSASIIAVAIDDTGVSLVGGYDNAASGINYAIYLALVSPSGIATRLTSTTPTGAGQSRILSISFPRSVGGGGEPVNPIIASVVPSSLGPGNSVFASPLFAFSSQALTDHLTFDKALSFGGLQKTPLQPVAQNLTSDLCIENPLYSSSENKQILFKDEDTRASLWVTSFGNYVYQKQEGSLPGAKATFGGVLTAFDWKFRKNALFGLGAAYAYNSISLLQNLGVAKVNQELLTAYYSFARKHFAFNLALWGGMYQTKNIRNSNFGISSRSTIHGWLFLPHAELSIPFPTKEGKILFDPFVMLDYFNNWQNHFQEKGVSGLNLIMGDQYGSLLRTETGIRFFQICEKDWGSLILKEKFSFVNQHPIKASTAQVAFVGSISSFGVELFGTKNQNLGAFQFGLSFLSHHPKPSYCSLNYQIEGGTYLLNQFGSLEIGKRF